jgi:hypothetical protein
MRKPGLSGTGSRLATGLVREQGKLVDDEPV